MIGKAPHGSGTLLGLMLPGLCLGPLLGDLIDLNTTHTINNAKRHGKVWRKEAGSMVYLGGDRVATMLVYLFLYDL